MELFDDLESQLWLDLPVDKPVHVQYKGQRLCLRQIQIGRDFVLGSFDGQQVAFRNSTIDYIVGPIPSKSDLYFSQFLENLTWPRRVSFKLFGSTQIGIEHRDGFIRFQDRNSVYWKPVEAIELLLIWAVENRKR